MKETKYKDIYVDECGDVYKLVNGKDFHKFCKWVDNVGYYQIVFRVDEKRHYVRVHRLIAETLISNPENLPQVNHKDGDKLNNAISNLEWCTNSYNTKAGYEAGLYHNKHRSHKIKVTNKITGESVEYKSIRNCADMCGVNRKTITSILKGIKKTNNYNFTFEYL